MTDYSELVKALRERARREDEYYEHGGDVINDAADAIEALQAEVDALKHDIERYVQMNTELLNDRPEVEEIGGKWVWKEPKRGEWELIDGAEPMRWGCSRCKYMSWETSNYCPRCGAKMEEAQDDKA